MIDAPALRLVNVWKAFERGRHRVSVLEDVSIEVRRGTIAAVVGNRDQGKTTLIGVAAGMVPPDRGRVFVDGREMTGASDQALSSVLGAQIGLAARTGPETRVTVQEHVDMALSAVGGMSRHVRRARVEETLHALHVSDCASLMWTELSDWQRVLVSFAHATVVRPRLLLIDDLVDGLNLGRKQAAMELVEGFASDLRCGVLMAVSDHAAALRSAQVWQFSHARLRLLHSVEEGTGRTGRRLA